MIKIDLIENISKIDQFYIEIVIIDSIKSLESKLNHNRRSNSDRHFNLTTTIPFGTSNPISLLAYESPADYFFQFLGDFGWRNLKNTYVTHNIDPFLIPVLFTLFTLPKVTSQLSRLFSLNQKQTGGYIFATFKHFFFFYLF